MLDKVWIDDRKEHERAVAESVFSSPELLVRIGTLVSEDDFHNDFYAAIFSIGSILNNAGKLTIQSLRTHMRKRGFLASDSELIEFNEMKQSVSTQGEWHAAELARLSSLEKLQRLLSKELQIAQEITANPDDIKSRVEANIEAIVAKQTALWETAGELAHRVYRKHKAHLEDPSSGLMGLSTGIEKLDSFTGGYFPQQLWQIAARSYFGKTTVALGVVSRLVRPEKGPPAGVYFASYEMSNEELQERMFADLLGIPLTDFTQGTIKENQLNLLLQGVAEFESCPIVWDEHPPETVAALGARLKLAIEDHGIKVLVVDHIQQMPLPRGARRHEHLSQIARDFKKLAKDLKITVIMLNQLNAESQKEGKNGEVGEPTNLHFSEGKAVLESLDVSLLLHRKDENDEKMKVIISKNKKGAKASFYMRFLGQYQRIEAWDEYEQTTAF